MLVTQDIVVQLRATATLLALHGANSFHVQHYQQAAQLLKNMNVEGSPDIMQLVPSLGKPYKALVEEFLQTGTFQRYVELMEQTPRGLLTILALPGLGPKKVRALWQGLAITTLEQLHDACQQGKVATLAGFGTKTQTSILANMARMELYQQQYHYATAWHQATALGMALEEAFPALQKSLVGELRRMLPVVQHITWLVTTDQMLVIKAWLGTYKAIQEVPPNSGPFVWRGYFIDTSLPLQVLFCSPSEFYKQVIIQTGSPAHLALPTPAGLSLGQAIYKSQALISEEAGYQALQFPYIAPEVREGVIELSWIAAGMPSLVIQDDLKGLLHIHTTYSDGKDTVLEMANYCKEAGYLYMGVTDHSQSASYAGGLTLPAIEMQHRAIEALNATLTPFKIFKGIEVDVLPDGSLDYPDDILAKFDFCIASVHMGLSMSEEKATARLIKAIRNPFTTLLGHPTGRLLLKREGYPIDHKAVIRACAAHGVAIELNANHWRLDLDWTWIPFALEQGVKISINPDAHTKSGIDDLSLALALARKGGLTPNHTINVLNVEELGMYFQYRKQQALIQRNLG